MRPYTQSGQIRIHFIWACLAGVVLFFILGGYVEDCFASKEISPWLEAILVGWLFISGPLGFASYLIRAYRSWVAVDPEQGIIRRGRPAIPWAEIQWIEWKLPWEGMHRQESRMFPMSSGVNRFRVRLVWGVRGIAPMRIPAKPKPKSSGSSCTSSYFTSSFRRFSFRRSMRTGPETGSRS